MNKTELARADAEVDRIIEQMMLSAGALAFIPGAGIVLSSVVDVALVGRIAAAYGVSDFDYEMVIAPIAATLTGRFASSLLLSFVPFLGWAINAGVAAAVTRAAGEMLKEEFRRRSPYAR